MKGIMGSYYFGLGDGFSLVGWIIGMMRLPYRIWNFEVGGGGG